MSTRLRKGDKTIVLTEKAHIDAYKAKGWTVELAAKPKATAEEKKEA